MKTNVNNPEKVQSALDHEQKGMRAGLFDARSVKREAEAAERALEAAGIPASLRQGALAIVHARTGTKHWAYATTVIFLERGATDWFLTDVVRDTAWDERRVRICLPTGFNLVKHAERVLRAAGVTV